MRLNKVPDRLEKSSINIRNYFHTLYIPFGHNRSKLSKVERELTCTALCVGLYANYYGY